jgi:cytochrome c556
MNLHGNRLKIYGLIGAIVLSVAVISAKITADHNDIWNGVGNNMKHIMTNTEDISKLKKATLSFDLKLKQLFKENK